MSLDINKRAVLIEDITKKRLESGSMPTSTELLALYMNEAIVRKSSSPSKLNATFLNDNLLDHNLVNDLIEEIEIDNLSMRLTLDEAWKSLRMTVDKMFRTLPEVERSAELVTAIATRNLSLIPEADSVRVGTEAISISAGVNFGTVNGADMALSNNVEIDMSAGVLTLSRSGISVIPATTNKSNWSVSGEYKLRTDRTIGDPTWTTDGSIAKTWSVLVSSPSRFGQVKLTTNYSLNTISSTLKRVEVLAPDFFETQIDIYVDIDGLGNYTYWSSSTGRGTIIVEGSAIHAKNVRMEISRFVANDTFYSGSSVRYGYGFQITEVSFVSSAYASSGNVVSDSVPMNYDQILSTKVDVDAIVPATAVIRTYIARDIDGATSINDFKWNLVSDGANVSDIIKTRLDSEFITAIAPQKVRTGAGVYSNSIYSIGNITGKPISILEGYNQLELTALTVQADEDGIVPSARNVSFTGASSVISRSGATLVGGNFFRVETSIFSDGQGSQELSLVIDEDAAEKIIFLNGTDITSRYESGQKSIALNQGKNDLVILVSSGVEAKNLSFALGDVGGCSIAIAKPLIVQEMSLNGTQSKMALSGNALLINHNPTGRVFSITSRKSTGTQVEAIRLRIELIRGIGGESPQVKRAFVTTGL